MKFKQLIKLYETKQKGPPYLSVGRFGTKWWHKDREKTTLHRTEKDPETGLTLPAVEFVNGDKFWYKDGQQHRDEKDPYTGLTLPAVEYGDGDKFWYKYGKQHRLDGPAVELENGETYWYINDIQLSPKEIEEQKKKLAVKNEIQSHKNNRIDPGMLEDYL